MGLQRKISRLPNRRISRLRDRRWTVMKNVEVAGTDMTRQGGIMAEAAVVNDTLAAEKRWTTII